MTSMSLVLNSMMSVCGCCTKFLLLMKDIADYVGCRNYEFEEFTTGLRISQMTDDVKRLASLN